MFAAALLEVCCDLSRQVVADGEGATVLAQIDVLGAVDETQARAIARRIATSPLVKTALFGHDPNWGRVLMAAGSAPYNDGYAEIDTEPALALVRRRRGVRAGAAQERAGGRRRHLRDRARSRRSATAAPAI